ncbi:MAG: Flp pilus assembly protein CpaB [Deltaproteobacteria bacterium]|nr:Flp pilus assembly protein CpaB [Deltaproteobacteria bacterium]
MNTATNSPEAKIVGKNRLKAIAFFLLAAVVGIAGLFLIMRYMDQIKLGAFGSGNGENVAVATVPVVVASVDLPIATSLQAKHLKVVRWPKDNVPEGVRTAVQSLTGSTTLQAIVKGEPILSSRVAGPENEGMAALLTVGKRAMAVQVDSVVGVAGFVRPGDFVDVITTMTPDDETREQMENAAAKVSKIILQNIRVLAVGEHLETENRKPTKVKVVTLEVDAAQSEKLALGSQHGKIQLTMRSRIDQEQQETVGVTPLALLAPDAEELETQAVAPQDTVAAIDKKADKEEYKRKAKHRRRDKVESKPEEPVVRPNKPEEPVVEILRGGTVEKRKLMQSKEN